jgi:hypothetical protein
MKIMNINCPKMAMKMKLQKNRLRTQRVEEVPRTDKM